LKVAIRGAQLQRLAEYPAPTYVIGIDERRERGYIVSANGESPNGFSSMCTNYPLTSDVLAMLHTEVGAYWASGPEGFRSMFIDGRWR